MRLFSRSAKLNSLRFSDYMNSAFLSLVALVALLPIIYIINHAFKPARELMMYPPRFFVISPTMQNFNDLFFAVRLSVVPFSRFIFNSVLVTLFTVGFTVTFGAMCAYALSKMEFKGKKIIFGIIVLSIMFSAEAVGITRYLVIGKLGIINTYFAHILPHIAMPVGVFLIKQFMDQFPDSIMEAARIDGAKEWSIFASVVVPNILPAIGTAAILSFRDVWTDAGTSSLYMIDEAMKTLPYFVHTLTSGATGTLARQGASAAASLLMFIPNFLIFVIMKKSMIETLVNSGIK